MIDGTAGGPCMAPHDTPTVGGIKDGDANTQTYQAPTGRKITRICAASQWSSGKIDHSSHYKDYSDDCYTITGIGTQTVTVKRIAETYSVPEWQTGPEAGKCSPLVHLDVFLSAAPDPTATPTPTTNPTSSSQPSSSHSVTAATTSPTPSSTSNANTAPKTSPSTTTEKPENTETNGSVMGATTSAKPAMVATTQATSPQNLPALFTSYWWMLIPLLLAALALVFLYFYKRMKR
jgi:hypothetical protein